MPTQKPRSFLRAILVVVLAISGILYSLADRYLIQHVEIANASAYAEAASQLIDPNSTVPEKTYPVALPLGADAETSVNTLLPIVGEGWDVQTDNLTITVSQVTTGSGSGMVNYFVAEVILTDATQLRSAFAENSFGRNIVEATSTIAEQNDALFAINGDYYGFRTDGIVIRNGVIYRDVPARTGLAFYRDGSMEIYDETQTSAQALLDMGVWNTLSFGPALLEDGTIVNNEGTINIDTNFGNHPVSGNQPRTGIGMIDENHFVFVVVDGRSPGYSRGVSLEEFAQIFKDLGCTDAYNLDGGGSSTMFFQGQVVNNPLGKNRERGTSDILYIGVN